MSTACNAEGVINGIDTLCVYCILLGRFDNYIENDVDADLSKKNFVLKIVDLIDTAIDNGLTKKIIYDD